VSWAYYFPICISSWAFYLISHANGPTERCLKVAHASRVGHRNDSVVRAFVCRSFARRNFIVTNSGALLLLREGVILPQASQNGFLRVLDLSGSDPIDFAEYCKSDCKSQ
jgi:hypothetical protein